MRYKQRFFICQLDLGEKPETLLAAASAITTSDIFNALRLVVTEAFGDVGLGRMSASLSVKYYSPVTRLCVIRGPLASEAQLHAAIALLKAVKKAPAALRTLQICGAVRTLRSALLHWHGEITGALRVSLGKDDVALDDSFFAALDAELADVA